MLKSDYSLALFLKSYALDPEKIDSLIVDCRLYDSKAQEELYKHYYPRLFNYLKRTIPDNHELASIVNDSFIKAFNNIEKFSPNGSGFEAWMKTIVKNTALDHLRKEKRNLPLIRTDALAETSRESVYPDTPESVLEMIHQLPEVSRKVVVLYIEGYKHKEIADFLKISEPSSRWYLHDARKRLRRSSKAGC